MAQLTCPHCQHAFFAGPFPPFWHDPSAIDSTGYTALRQPDRRPNANVPQLRPPTAPNARHYADGSKRAESQSPPNLTLPSRLHPLAVASTPSPSSPLHIYLFSYSLGVRPPVKGSEVKAQQREYA